eukprot:TRINITY_DN31152_c0_g1_i1.p1 TRINITY_DN31152_c0_g1~~TRINITY_DN31152_c0_g1_i1.p1  ORF type:complete len:218 (+),score=39.74 TRINITY_DN31152_c0_g1_i1:62-715(+)
MANSLTRLLLAALCISAPFVFSHEADEFDAHEHTHDSEDHSQVTCGSVIKLRHVPTNFRLHSHEINYGSGSGQQSVTGFPATDDTNSLWQVRGAGDKRCLTGTPLKNGDIVRILHLNTRKNLHSHLHQSPLTQQQEVSAFNDRGGDSGDNWKIVTDGAWKRGQTVRFVHVDTGKYLSSNKNKFQHPIPGQQEIAAIAQASRDTEWAAEEGVYFPART